VKPEPLLQVPFAAWSEFLPEFMDSWEPNRRGEAEHLSIVGPTKQGKTTLVLSLLLERARRYRSHVVIFATKPRDLTLTSFAKRNGWAIIREWPPGYGQEQVIFWPKFGDVRGAHVRQRAKLEPVMAQIFADGGRTVFIDEVAYFHEDLKLGTMLRQYWQQGRSQNLLVVGATQRPRGVPRQMFSECSWFIAFRTADEDELRRVGEIGGTDSQVIRAAMRTLRPHEFLVVKTRTGEMVRSKFEQGGRRPTGPGAKARADA
jgi:hypothetical protein